VGFAVEARGDIEGSVGFAVDDAENVAVAIAVKKEDPPRRYSVANIDGIR